jgi:hypothetical protein
VLLSRVKAMERAAASEAYGEKVMEAYGDLLCCGE